MSPGSASHVRVSLGYLVQEQIANATLFGTHAVVLPLTVLAPSVIANAQQFGAHTAWAAQKTFSYSNPPGTGDRTTSITATTSGGSIFDSPEKLVNGNIVENALWGYWFCIRQILKSGPAFREL